MLFSFIGFQRKLVPAKSLKEKSIVYLDRTSYNLNEVVIAAESDYLYDILGKCRRKMQGNKVVQTAKTYYSVETKANDTIVEFLECYYNAYFQNMHIEQLKFKQGRFGLAKVDGNYFVTMGTSKAIADIDLLENKGYFPYVPTQLKRRKLKRNFNLKHLGTFDNYYKISFKAKNNEAFNGVILIDTSSFDILQLKLHVENTPKHPFVSLYPASDDRVSKLSINLNYQFTQYQGNSRLELIDLQYSFDYLSDRSFAVSS